MTLRVDIPETIEELEARLYSAAYERFEEPAYRLLKHATEPVAERLQWMIASPSTTVGDILASLDDEPVFNDDEWRGFCSTLLEWAGDRGDHGGVPGFEADGELAPSDRADLLRYIARHGMRDAVGHPAERAAGLTANAGVRYALLSFRGTIGAALKGDQGDPRRRDGVRAAARSYLAWIAGRRARARRRAELLELTIPHPALARSAARVRALLEELSDVEVEPLPASAVVVGPLEDEIGFGVIAASTNGYGRREAAVSYTMRVGERAYCSLDERYGQASRPLVKLCAEQALDALIDVDSPYHEAVRDEITRPRWAHLLSELERTMVVEPHVGPMGLDERLVWRVEHLAEGQLDVEAAIQKRGKKKWSKGRRIDVHKLRGWLHRLDERDARAVEASSRGPGAIWRALVGHPRVVRAEDPLSFLRVREVAPEVKVIELRDEETGPASTLRFRAGDLSLDAPELRMRLPDGRGMIAHLIASKNEVQVAEIPPMMFSLATAAARWETPLPPQADGALVELLSRLPPTVGVELPPRLRGARVDASLVPLLFMEPLPGGGLRAQMRMQPFEGATPQLPGAGPQHLIGSDGGRRAHAVRDLPAERVAAERVAQLLGLDGRYADGPHSWRLDEPEDALDLLSALREANEPGEDGVERPPLAILRWPEDALPRSIVGEASWNNTRVSTRQKGAWFELRGEVTFDEDKITVAQVMRALREGRRYVSLGKGRFARIEEELRASLEAAADVVHEEDGEMVVASVAVSVLETALPEHALAADVAVQEMKKRIEAASDSPVEVPSELVAELRGYQREGIHWLMRNAQWASGACLADDMGLGKTLQALALILERSSEGPTIVVGPTSLSDNWRREAERFAPTLKPMLYRGPDRAEMLEKLGPRDLLITSYDILLRDIEALGAIHFATAVFDEAHAVKNARAQRTQAAMALDAGFRVGLTGTPLENHLGELWSLYSVLVPGLFGSLEHFRRRFQIPIERDGDTNRREALRELLRPFLLRRTKDQVAPELPPRVEVVRTVELSEAERVLYEAERRTAMDALGEQADPKQRFAVLAALTRLRRLACHPRLVDATSNVASSKLREAVSLAEDLVAEGHRTLIFSQFTSHLALVREALEARGYAMLHLDGSTPAKDRQRRVEAFQAGEAPFFLISLKAGGTGLNLTAADTVIHLDPWWNPAAEDQASDRTHRIGQDKPVTVIRLVAQHTIEEQVLALHAEKRDLARGILEGAETNAKLDTKELLELLSAGD